MAAFFILASAGRIDSIIMTPENFNWQEFNHGIIIRGNQERVFERIATAQGIASWFLGSAIYTDPEGNFREDNEKVIAGDQYTWNWLQKDYVVLGEVVETDGVTTVSFSFGDPFVVTFEVRKIPETNKVRVDLLQSYTSKNTIKGDFGYINCCVCWVFFLTNLKSVIEHGIDLRETEVHDEALVNR